MIKRFEGPDGERHLITVLESCHLVAHDRSLAERLAKAGQLVPFSVGDPLVMQGGTDNDVYFILVGQVDVLVNNRHVAIREQTETIGEMALLDPAAPRSATVTARTPVVALKVSEPDFHQIAEDYPRIWKVVAHVVAERLRQRAAFLSVPNTRPVLFIGCSAESLIIAQEIQLGLKHSDIEVMIWTDGVFGPSTVTIDALTNAVNASDFAAFVFSPDDIVVSRSSSYNAPRDNTVFELGLFMGRLERSRTFIVKEQNSDVKIPTDLLGITQLTYVHHSGGDLTASIGPVCTELRKIIQSLGTR